MNSTYGRCAVAVCIFSVAASVLAAPVIVDPGFEYPVQPANAWKQTNGAGGGTLVGANWTFSSSAGISRNISAFQGGSVTAPEGEQLALIQSSGSVSQTLSGFEPGKIYQLIVSQRARSGQANDLQVHIGGQQVGGTWATSIPFADYRTSLFTVGTASPVLEFRAVNPVGGDRTTFFDNVRVQEVAVTGPTILNAGFEDPAPISGVGYGVVDGWSASQPDRTGINTAGGPFLNGQTAPEGSRVGFIQYTGSLSQQVAGLTPGHRYQLVYREGERGYAAGTRAQASATLDGNAIVPLHDVVRRAAFSTTHSLPFTATASMASLVISNTSGSGDNTLLLDGLALRRLDGPVVADSGFENPPQSANTWKQANGAGSGTLAGSAWTFVGGAGITRNYSGFQNGNIPAPEGVQHALLQAAGSSMKQTITGFSVGTQYQLSLMTMARQQGLQGGSDLEAFVDFGLPTQVKILDLAEVIYTSFTDILSHPFLAYKDSYELTIRTTNNDGLLSGDRTTFVDDVQFLTTVPEPATLLLAGAGIASLARYIRRRRN